MRAGLMDKRAEIVKLVRAKDIYGAETVTTESKGMFWCNVATNIDGRDIGGDRVQYTEILTFKFRLLIPLASDDIIRFQGKDYRIMSVNDNHIGDYKEVKATETDSYALEHTNIR